MATNSTSNIIVGAAAVAVGTPNTSYTASGVDGVFAAIRTAATGTPKDYRGWVNGLSETNSTVLGSTNVAFRNCGFTQDGVEVSYSPDYGEIEVDQLLDVARLFKQKMSVQVKTTFAEPILENLLVVWDDAQTIGGYGGNSERNIYARPGELGDAPTERHLFFVGPAPGQSSGKQRCYLTTRAISIEASSHSLKRNEATVFPVTFRLLPDVSSSYSAYGKIVDVLG